MTWFFSSDLHGQPGRYRALFQAILDARPRCVLLGGDLMPPAFAPAPDILADIVVPALEDMRRRLGDRYPRILVIPGNDDVRALEPEWLALQDSGLWEYLPGRWTEVDGTPVLGYPWVPPTPFRLKDWERYDVSRFVDPGCVAPEDGAVSVPISTRERRLATIADDLARLAEDRDLDRAVLLCHAPPYDTDLDRAALDGKMVDHVPLDVHVGSIALRRFIEAHGPRMTLHGHVHESARLTGTWKQQLGPTWCLSGCHDGPELSLVTVDPAAPGQAKRRLLPPV